MTFSRKIRFLVLLFVLSWGVGAGDAAAADPETTFNPPAMNVVFILADDLGWNDTTLYGTTRLYETPNLERLTARGMTFGPLQHGFDVDVPHHPGPGPAGGFVVPWELRNFKANYAGEHIEDRMAEEAVKWMKSVDDQPFFLDYWQFSVHAPFDAKAELIERYRTKVDANDPQRSPTYAAMVHSFDDAIGTLLDAIDAEGISERTVIIMTSDNGGKMYNEVDGTTPTSNSPLRGGKASMFEGGVRVPCVVVWPGVTKPGTRSDAIIQTSDFYPTILNQLGVALPDNHIIDGIEITPALRGGELDRDAIFTYFPHSPPVPDWLPASMSVHSGDLKLIRLFHNGENEAHDYLLYNLAEDLSEKNNLAEKYPDEVKRLDAMIQQHIVDTGAVVPQPNPKLDPSRYRPELIGVGKIRDKKGGPAKTVKSRTLSRAAGWAGSGTCRVTTAGSNLVVTSDGEDPYLFVENFPSSDISRLGVRLDST